MDKNMLPVAVIGAGPVGPAAERTELVLPQSGVCSGGSECCEEPAADCCAPSSTCC